MADGEHGRTGASVAPRVVSASGDGTETATHLGRRKTGTLATETTSTMTFVMAPNAKVSSFNVII